MSDILATSPALPHEARTVEGRLADILANDSDRALRLGEYTISDSDRALIIAALRLVAGIDYWKHLKRGTTYRRLAESRIQTTGFVYEGDKVEIYRADVDGTLHVRRASDFHDGRFEKLED